eukprot:268806_1
MDKYYKNTTSINIITSISYWKCEFMNLIIIKILYWSLFFMFIYTFFYLQAITIAYKKILENFKVSKYLTYCKSSSMSIFGSISYKQHHMSSKNQILNIKYSTLLCIIFCMIQIMEIIWFFIDQNGIINGIYMCLLNNKINKYVIINIKTLLFHGQPTPEPI